MEIDKELLKGSTAMLVLKILSDGDLYGYGIIKELERKSDSVFSFKEGTLYPILHGLEGKTLIESYWEDSASLRKRRYYHITEKGKKFLHDKQREWQLFTRSVNQVLGGEIYAG